MEKHRKKFQFRKKPKIYYKTLQTDLIDNKYGNQSANEPSYTQKQITEEVGLVIQQMEFFEMI